MKPAKVLVLTLLLALLVMAPGAQAVTYYFQPLFSAPNGLGTTSAEGINNSGQVVGYFTDTNSVSHGFLRSADGLTYTQIDAPNATSTLAFGINNSGQISGYFTNATGPHGFVRSADGSTYTTIDYPGSQIMQTLIYYIDDAGQTTGNFTDGNWSVHAFVRSADGSTYTPIGYGQPYGINNASPNQITGFYYTNMAPEANGFLGSASGGSQYTSFNDPASSAPGATYGQGINDSGQIVGYFIDSSISTGMVDHGFVLSADLSTYTQIDYPSIEGGSTSVAGINNSGTITGTYQGYGFIATLTPPPPSSISGTVTYSSNGSPFPGVTMTLAITGSSSQTTTTAADGSYTFSGVAYGSTYTVTPSLAQYTFSPAYSSGNINGSNLTLNFTGALSTAVNGVCGPASTEGFLTAPRTNLCSKGTASTVTGTGPWYWTCKGTGGGTTVGCSANLKVNGACGTANAKAFTTPPSTNLCTKGTFSGLTGSGPWTWTCAGAYGGTPADCSAKLEVIGACGSATANSYTKPTSNFCSSGTPSAVTGEGPWNWTCAGSNGGATARCSAKLEADGVCGTANGSNSLTKPVSNLCAKGTASTVAGTGPWDWSCVGLNGGTTVGCSANLKVNGTCGTANAKSFTTAPATNLCAKGTPSTVTGSGPWDWTCVGLNNGTTAHCSARLE
ncbi:MAG: carboxypeptidase regulatory-like domain-containing protein [Syntrophobacteraceae bacterium]